ncbi:MAG: GNAT family N-acetyltransferase [Litorimonas sp.]
MTIEKQFAVGEIKLDLIVPSKRTFEATFLIKKDAMHASVDEKWGWEDPIQRNFHKERFFNKPFHSLSIHGQTIGTVSIQFSDTFIQFGEFYILQDWRRKGLGSKILKAVTDIADHHAMPIRLEHLKWNPVRSLYRRHGFIDVKNTDIHIIMERPAKAAVQ